MIKIYFLLSLFITLIKACSYLQNEAMQIISTPNEVINIQFASIFKINQFNKITLFNDDNQFVIVKPIELIEQSKANSQQNSEVVSYKLFKTKKSRDPLHQMAILVKVKDYYVVEFNSNIYNTLPSINSVTERVDQPNSICYDVIQVDSIFIVDCQKEDQDYFSIGQDNYIPIQKAKNQQRRLDQIDNYIFRSTVNELELYIYELNTVQFIKILDQITLSQILKKDNFKLEIRDFKTHSNGQISILNSQGELIILEYSRQKDEWILIKNIDTKTQNAIGYDIDIDANQYVVIQEQNLYFKSKTSLEYLVNITKNERNNVYLTKNYILLSKQDSLVLYNQKLEKLYSILIDQSKYKYISNPNFDSIIALDNTDIYRYSINNDYYLRFKSDKLQDQYSSIQIIQDSDEVKCGVLIYYRVVPIETLEMFQTQASSALFAYGVNLDEQMAKFQQACQGPNLKFEFYNSDILKVQVQNYKEVILKNLDLEEIIYRKAISNLNTQNIYLIQQKQNLQIEGFICEITSQTIINCNIWFEKIIFPKLEDSQQQLWWMTQDGLYFAILNDKAVKLYYLSYDKKEFQEFQVIQLQTQGKSITTDGSQLFILIEKDVEIYEINSKEWKKLTVGLKDVNQIFASPYKQDMLLVYDNINLYLYSIQYQKITLIWFTPLESQIDINIAITNGQFSILIKSEEIHSLLTYNIQNEGNIYFQRKHSLYHHAKGDISLFDCNYFNNQLYIIGNHEKTDNKAILVYKLTEVSINSQFMILDIPTTQLSSANNFVFITEANQNKFYSYYIDGNYFVSTSFNIPDNQQIYNKNIKIQGRVSNTDFYRIIKDIPISLINRGINIFGIENELNFNYEKDGNNSHCFDLGQSWYSGQAFEIDLQQQGNGDIKLQKTLIKQEQSIEYSQSIMEYDNNTLIQLISNKIIFISKQDFQIIEYQLDNQYQFINILYIQSNLIYLQAIFNKQYFIKLLQFKDSQIILQNGQITYNYYIKKAFLNQDRFFTWIYNYAIAYDTKNDPTNLNEFEVIQRVFPSFYPVSLEFKHVKDQIYYFFFISQSAQLEIAAYEIVKNSQKNFFLDYHTADNLKLQGMFFPLDYTCSGMVMTENQVVISLNNSISYAFNYQIACQDNYLCQITQFSYKNSYQQYGSWSLKNEYPSLFVSENILSIIYQSEKDHELLLYDLNDNSNKTGPISAIAYLKSKNLEDQKIVQSFVYNYKEQLHLLSSAEDKQKLQHYIIRRSPQICIEKQSISQNVNISLKNQNQEKLVNLKLNIDQIKSDSSHFKIWIILVIVLVIVIVGISVIIYCQKKRRRLVKQNLLIED
ncbi:unnamed protein product [Paramecium pentaurelia]|uniref:Transmembrane protein n=1 Tax=Paramecium pentaurelia TaxID=43138 RepID=A0A8S1V3H1_9CILI|nr:unnamed protein product [Paramecium pentaurelia]